MAKKEVTGNVAESGIFGLTKAVPFITGSNTPFKIELPKVPGKFNILDIIYPIL